MSAPFKQHKWNENIRDGYLFTLNVAHFHAPQVVIPTRRVWPATAWGTLMKASLSMKQPYRSVLGIPSFLGFLSTFQCSELTNQSTVVLHHNASLGHMQINKKNKKWCNIAALSLVSKKKRKATSKGGAIKVCSGPHSALTLHTNWQSWCMPITWCCTLKEG